MGRRGHKSEEVRGRKKGRIKVKPVYDVVPGCQRGSEARASKLASMSAVPHPNKCDVVRIGRTAHRTWRRRTRRECGGRIGAQLEARPKARGPREPRPFVAKQADGHPRCSGCRMLVRSRSDKVRTARRDHEGGQRSLLRGVHRIALSREFMSSRVSARLAFVPLEPIRPPVMAPAACR